MKTLIKLFVLVLLTSLNNTSITAQEKAATSYNVIDYMHVKPGMRADYLKLEKVWKKIHQAQVKAGAKQAWVLSQIVMPSGSSVQYNYITRQNFKGEAQLAAYMETGGLPENWKSLLTPEEIALVDRTGEIRTFVKQEIWSTSEYIESANMKDAKVMVFNFFDYPEGKGFADHTKVEKDIWIPMHKARIDAGNMKGWVHAQLEFPYGAGMPYHGATVDIYKDMAQMLMPAMEGLFKKVHPGKNMDDLMKATRKNSTLLKSEVRVQLDRTE